MQNYNPTNKQPVNLAITGFGGLHHPEAGSSIAETIAINNDSELRLTGLVKNLKETSAWTTAAIDHIVKVPEDWSEPSSVWEELRRTLIDHSINVIIPGTHQDACVLSKFSEALQRIQVKTLLPSVSSIELLNPEALSKIDFSDRVKIPRTIRIARDEDVADLTQMIGFPLMMRSDQLPVRAIYDVSAIKTIANECFAGDSNLYVQEFAAGEAFEISGLFDQEGELVTSAMIRGIAMRRDGTVGAGAIVDDPYLEEVFIQLGNNLNWKGILTASFRLNPSKKTYYLVDLRAHLPYWSMATHWANRNLPEAYLGCIMDCAFEKNKKLHSPSLYISSIIENAFPVSAFNQLQQERSVSIKEHTSPRLSDEQKLISSSINVAVTGLSSLDMVNPGLGVAKALRKSDITNELIGIAYDHFDSGIYQKSLLNKAYKFDYDTSQNELLKNIAYLNSIQPINVLIPCLDGELQKVIGIKESLHELGIKTLLPTEAALKNRSKKGLCKLTPEWGVFSIPSCCVVSSAKEAKALFNKLGGPLVVKGPEFGCVIVKSQQEIEASYQYFESIGEDEVIVQRKVDGEHYAVSVVCNENHEVVSAVSIKKFARCERGSTWGAVNVSLPQLEQAFAELLKSIQWVGPAEGEFILDPYSNLFYLFEVNPRFTGWVYFTALLGCNQPQIAVELALSREITSKEVLDAKFFVRSMEETKITSRDLAMFTTQGKCVHA